MDAITLLKADHKTVEALFKRFEKAGETAYAEKRNVVDRIVEELSVHAAVEEQFFYPVAQATVPGTEDLALESLEEHSIVKWLLSDLDSMDPQHERFDAKVTVLIENVRHHVREEEQDFFPKVRDELGRNALSDLGNAMTEAKSSAPTHPHPRAPDSPPANAVVGAAAGVVDRVGDTVGGVAQGSVNAAQDLIALILGRKKPRVSPQGSKVARDAANEVRSRASTATDQAIDTVRQAKRTGEATLKKTGQSARRSTAATKDTTERTVRAAAQGVAKTARTAKSGAKATATSARKAAGNTRTSAKRASTSTGRAAKKAVKTTTRTAKRSTKKAASSTKRNSPRS